MTEPTIRKSAAPEGVSHYLSDYETARRGFTWEGARRTLTGNTDCHLNMTYQAVDRHVERGLGDRIAARFVDRTGSGTDLTYEALRNLSGRFSNVLHLLGLEPGSSVATLLGRVPELFTTALGTLRAGNVFCPLFPSFAPEPIKTRLELGHVRVLVTTEECYRRKIAGIREALAELRHVLLIRKDEQSDLPFGTLDVAQLMRLAPETYELAPTRDTDLALLLFSGGTREKPEGVTLTHGAVIALHATSRLVLDLHPGETFWCATDPGSVSGIAYGLIGALTCAATLIVDREAFEPQRCYHILAQERINIWYAASTAIDNLMKAGAERAQEGRYPHLRHMASVGGPLSAEAVLWGVQTFGMPFHDTWWQTRTGSIMIANFAACEVRPGSMGRAIPGLEARVLRREAGKLEVIDSPQEIGEIALRPGWPSMFSGYLDNAEGYRASFVDGWYLAGDFARRDRDGYFWFVGRTDDA